MEYRYAYDPQGPELRFMHRHVVGQWRSLTEIFSVVVMLLFLYVTVTIAIRESAGALGALHPALESLAPLIFWAGIVLGLAAAWLCGLLIRSLQSTISDVEREGAVYRRGPVKVTLTRDGILSETAHDREFIRWAAVRAVRSTPQGVALRLDNDHFVPIPDTALPEGIQREEIARAVVRWRAAQ